MWNYHIIWLIKSKFIFIKVIFYFIYLLNFFFNLAEERITRDCLSSLKGFRTDIPADKYEGCRKGAEDVKLGHYVNNSIPQLDIKR